jgi:hypothetical protein
MNGTQVVELVLIEEDHGGEELYVLEWEYDRENEKIVYVKLFPLESWKKGQRDHPQYIAPKGDTTLYIRDESGYISTSNRLISSKENGRWYDEYGRAYLRSDKDLSLSQIKLKLFHLELLSRLDNTEIIRRMREGEYFNLNGLDPENPGGPQLPET